MATNEQLIQALVQALAVVLNRQPTPDERQLLIKHFDASSGTTFERAETAITKTANVQKRVLLEKSAASDDADRVMQDLKRIASQWKPSK